MTRHPASFRDPAGYLFRENGQLLRAVQETYKPHFQKLIDSGLKAQLEQTGAMLPFEEFQANAKEWKVLRPQPLPFVSYPYEWSFTQLKQAALHTLHVQQAAMQCGMTLKDATAYNIQFLGNRPVFIDHLSFECLQPGKPWVAYRQFCEHFLAPLALMHYSKAHLLPMLQAWPDGLPLAVSVNLLPSKSRLKPGLAMHLHLHHKTAEKAVQPGAKPAEKLLKANALENLVQHLADTVNGLSWKPQATHWASYTDGLKDSYIQRKEQEVQRIASTVQPATALVLGANTGHFANLVAQSGAFTVALESDATCVEQLVQQNKHANLLPLVMDLAAPSPALGFNHAERNSLAQRTHADLVLALALIHHLAIARNIPLPQLAEWMATLGKELLIEWVPKEDERTQWLLANRSDVFQHYNRQAFEAAFSAHFSMESQAELADSGRVLYHFKHRS